MKPRREDVARLAGVSAGSVSYYINKTRKISTKTEEKIARAIEELNYIPDMAALGLVKNESKLLTIVANDLSYPLYSELVICFEKEAMKCGYFTNICGGTFAFSEYLKSIVARKIDGIYILIHPNKITYGDMKLLNENDIKIVSGTGAFDDLGYIARVDGDYDGGLKLLVEHLIEKGHTEILYLNGLPENLHDVRERAYIKYMREHGLQPKIIYGKDINNMRENVGIALAETMVRDYTDVTAAICMSDQIARGVVTCLHRKGIRVPDDISLVSIDDTEICRYSFPTLTAVGFSSNEFARAAVESLICMIHGGICEKKVIGMVLSERESVKNLHGVN